MYLSAQDPSRVFTILCVFVATTAGCGPESHQVLADGGPDASRTDTTTTDVPPADNAIADVRADNAVADVPPRDYAAPDVPEPEETCAQKSMRYDAEFADAFSRRGFDRCRTTEDCGTFSPDLSCEGARFGRCPIAINAASADAVAEAIAFLEPRFCTPGMEGCIDSATCEARTPICNGIRCEMVAEPPAELTADFCPGLSYPRPRAPEGDAACVGVTSCETTSGTPDAMGCPNTCSCVCFEGACYTGFCTAIGGCEEPPVYR